MKANKCDDFSLIKETISFIVTNNGLFIYSESGTQSSTSFMSPTYAD